jgi:hypothetical protein
MNRLSTVGSLLLATTLAAPGIAVVGSTSADPDGLVVHEWGTFTSIADDEGEAVDWLPLQGPSDLPCFVERYRNLPVKPGLAGTVRMETPVLYFYAPAETTVEVSVRFRQGLITEWFPRASVTPAALPAAALRTAGFTSTARWDRVTIRPGTAHELPEEPGRSHYYAARHTDAAPLQVASQREKFLFYRGVGRFDVPVSALADQRGNILARSTEPGVPLGTLVLFENRGGRIGFEVRRGAGSHATFEPLALNGDAGRIEAEIEAILVASGLYRKEASAMVETWRDSWFEEGARLLYIVPAHTIDAVLPLTIDPRPATVVRVFVGRIELFTPATESAVREAFATRDTAGLQKYGRFLQPITERLFRHASREEWSRVYQTLEPLYQAQANQPCAPREAADSPLCGS